MRHIGSFVVVLFISAGLLGGVANAGAPGGAATPTVGSLLGGKYRSVKITGNRSIGNRQMRINFFRHSPDGTKPKPNVLVSAGCNTWGSRFEIRRGRLFLKGQVSGTKMACDVNPDPWLRKRFRKGLKIRTKGRRLFLSRPAAGFRVVLTQSGQGSVRPVDPVPQPDPEPRVTVPATKADVDGKSYKLIYAIGKKLDRGLRLGFRDGFKSDRDGGLVPVSSLGFYAGCNHMGGEYRIEDGILSLADVLTTDMWCQDSDDDWLHDFLTGDPEIGLDGTDLVLRKNGVEIVLREVAPDPKPRVTVPATMEDVLDKSYEAISVIGPDLDRPLKVGFAMGTRSSGPGEQVTRPTFGYYASCNHFGGSAEIENGILSWTEVISTLMLCKGTSDEWLTPFFKSHPEIGLDGTDLVIRKNGIEIAFQEIQK